MATPPRRGPSEKQFLKCPTCGLNVARSALTRGALGNSLQALKQQFVGRGHGDNGGPVIWTRRSMRRDELEHVARAVAVAAEAIAERLGGELERPEPEEVLASLDDDEAEDVGAAWIEEARIELARRERLVAEDYKRRMFE